MSYIAPIKDMVFNMNTWLASNKLPKFLRSKTWAWKPPKLC